MLKVTLKGIAAHKIRLLTTTLAVLLGVAFMAGTFVLTDTVGKTFDDLFATVDAGTDAVVRMPASVKSDEMGTQRPNIPARVLAEVERTPGVAAAEGSVQGYAQIVGKDGKAIGKPSNGPPALGFAWPTVPELNPLNLVAGKAPTRAGEVVIDKHSADEGDLRVGDRTTILTQKPPAQMTVVGIVKFGDADSPGGATVAAFDLETAQQLIGQPGTFDHIAAVADDGVSQNELKANLERTVGPGHEVVTGATYTEENQSDIRKGLSFFNSFMLTFALIALFVGSFMIYNTFSIIVAQRAREMALLRAIGAGRRQVFTSVVAEALAVGVVASVAGILAGLGLAVLLKAMLVALGFDLPATGLVLLPRTVIVSLIAGVGITLVSATVPARRASKVPPIAAMRDVEIEHGSGSRMRLVLGGLVLAAGIALLFTGLFGDGGIGAVGLGALVIFLGGAALGPVFVTPLARLVGWPLPRFRGVTGHLARENTMRNPKRTASTAAALMIGVGLVAFITVFGSSAKASINKTIDQSVTGDFVIDSGSFMQGGFSPDLAAKLNRVAGVEAATGIRMGVAELDGRNTQLLAVDPTRALKMVDVGVTSGDVKDLEQTNTIAVLDHTAESHHWKVGDTIKAKFPDTGATQPLKVVAIYSEAQPAGKYLTGTPTFDANYTQPFDAQVWVKLTDGTKAADVRPAIEQVAKAYPNADVQDMSEFKDAQAKQINQMLSLVYAMLILAVFIAGLGIANTLALSIFERTRELGLLRAVGMTRPQLRTSVRWEAVMISVIGAVNGIAIGIFFGWSVTRALSDQGFNQLRVPAGGLVIVLLLAAALGVIASLFPARRAARLDVLRAIAAD
jgi:putative ABC transport system permease protein